MLLNSKKVDIGVHAKDFKLKNVDNEIYTLNDIKKSNGFAKIASITTKSISSAYLKYKKNKE